VLPCGVCGDACSQRFITKTYLPLRAARPRPAFSWNLSVDAMESKRYFSESAQHKVAVLSYEVLGLAHVVLGFRDQEGLNHP